VLSVAAVFFPKYLREQHCLVLAAPTMTTGGTGVAVDVSASRPVVGGCAVDLTTGDVYTPGRDERPSRARQAWQLAAGYTPPRTTVWTRTLRSLVPMAPAPGLMCDLDRATGEITMRGPDGEGEPFLPRADGRPLLKGAILEQGQAAGDMLALRVQLEGGAWKLLLFQGPDLALLREIDMAGRFSRFLLSGDGRWVAVERAGFIEVEQVGAPGVRRTLYSGGYAPDARLYLGEGCLLISLGQGQKHWHLVRWTRETVEFHYEHRRSRTEDIHSLAVQAHLPEGAALVEVKAGTRLAAPLSYDPQRFRTVGYRGKLGFALDHFGELAVIDPVGKPLCMFMAFRNRLAAWLPDGSRCGSAALSLGPETPGARARLARVLCGE
jgi:hypothetical protein